MKVQLKIDQKAIQDFLLQHVEKIGLGIVVAIFLLMLYSALNSAARFDRTPDQLRTQTAAGRREIDATPAATGLTVENYSAEAQRSRVQIAAKPYANPTPWDPPLFERRPLRDVPPLLGVQQLRGAAGMGAFHASAEASTDAKAAPDAAAALPPARRPAAGRKPRDAAPMDMLMGEIMPMQAMRGGENTRGQRWVVITGLVPFEQQETAFLEAFRGSVFYDSQKDFPDYLGYWVERVEVAGPHAEPEPDWSKAAKFISSQAMADAVKRWGTGQTGDRVPQQFLEGPLAFPLGPLVNRPWDATVAHEPEIPLLTSGQPGGAMDGRRFAPGQEMFLGPEAMLGVEGRGRRRAAPAVANTPFGPVEPQAQQPAQPEPAQQPADLRNPKFRLFRFFDFSVEPGKHYVYRVRLGLRNPNEGVKATFLKNPELAKPTYLTTKWSDPTAVISTPRDTRILAVSVKPPAPRPGSEPSAQILVTCWLPKTGYEVFKEFSNIPRGQTVHYAGVEDAKSAGPPPGDKVDFLTDTTIVDMQGGQRLANRRDAPAAIGQILVLLPDGSLTVCDEAKDAAMYHQLVDSVKEPEAAPRLGPEAEMPFMMPDMEKPSPRRGKTSKPAKADPRMLGP